MLKLMNLSTYDYDFERFHREPKEITDFLEKHGLDGVELLHPIGWKEEVISKEHVKGVHLKYYPTWLDFWKDNKVALLEQFEDLDTVKKYYGDTHKEVMIEHYRKEIEMATKIGAEYMVFHVGHVEVEHAYDYAFTYSDAEVIDAAAEVLNEVFRKVDTNIKLLFENLWWPGFTMLNKEMAIRLLEKVEYSNKGFMLDTAHLMNTNLELRNEKEGIEYILSTINNLGELKNLIKGIHLNCSLSGKYVREQINKKKEGSKECSFHPLNEDVFMHVFRIDGHKPFTDPSVKKLVEYVNPAYLVHELIADSLQELDGFMEIQGAICGK